MKIEELSRLTVGLGRYVSQEVFMHEFTITTLLRIIVGGLNCLLVGLSALWQIVPFFRSLSTSETRAKANLR
ncbi:uncharacterized membrane protein YuzA (DUF378 family) [Rhizobium sp. SG_E_25_P2]|nr:uncharacterized membrane protein YuzA (DUF378 family) [Rhizobium sp. SG_E_25_P2]